MVIIFIRTTLTTIKIIQFVSKYRYGKDYFYVRLICVSAFSVTKKYIFLMPPYIFTD